MSLMLRVIGADAQNRSAGRQHAARHHEAHRGASRLLAAAEKGGGAYACSKRCLRVRPLTRVSERRSSRRDPPPSC